jgi:hypothetical protein
MLKVYSILFSLFVFIGCSSSAGTITADALSSALSSSIVLSLSCSNATQVQTDVSSKIQSWFEMQISSTNPPSILQTLCSNTIKEIVPTLIGTTVPANWGCSGALVTDIASSLAASACGSIAARR